MFKRSVDFDPQLDPVVRIEAGRLRRSLERYYLKAGRDDPIHIELPKGGYVPSFAFSDPTPAANADTPSAAPSQGVNTVPTVPNLPSVAIIPFRVLGHDPAYEFFALGITEELVASLTQFRHFRVLGPNVSFKLSPVSNPGQVARDLAVSFVLQGSVRILGQRIRVTVQLLNGTDDWCVWATSFDRELKVEALLEIQTEIAGTIAATLGAPYGAVARFSAQQLKRRVAPDLATYKCYVQCYFYRRSPTQDLHDTVRACLENAVKTAPDHAESWALLAYVYLDEFRFGLTGVSDRESLPDLALDSAQRAVQADGHSAFAHLALSLVHFHRREVDRAVHEGYRALELNPHNPEIMAQVGWRLAIPGRWDEGMRLFRLGMSLDPDPPDWFRLVLALDAFRQGDGPASLKEIRNGALVRIPIAYLVATAILADLGEADEAGAVARSGLAIFPTLFDGPEAQLRLYNMDPAVARRLMRSLRGGGFASPER